MKGRGLEASARLRATDVAALLAEMLEVESLTHPVRDVLDAGAGRDLPVSLPDGARVIGLDLFEESLSENPRLDERIVGDIETYPLPPGRFDVVLCWNVLEHLSHPLRALANLHSALRPGGILILGVPNLEAPKTLVTKLTPHRFHVWIYRRVLGNPSAGLPGYAPFPTFLRLDLAPRRLRRSLERLGFGIEAELPYASGMVEAIVTRNAALRLSWNVVAALWRALGLDPELGDVAWILRKGSASTAHSGGESGR